MTGTVYGPEPREDYLLHLSFATLLTEILKPRTLCIGKLPPAGEPQMAALSIAAIFCVRSLSFRWWWPRRSRPGSCRLAQVHRSIGLRPWHTWHTGHGIALIS